MSRCLKHLCRYVPNERVGDDHENGRHVVDEELRKHWPTPMGLHGCITATDGEQINTAVDRVHHETGQNGDENL